MKPRITVITLGVDDLERALTFYRDGLGLPTQGIVGREFEHGAVAFFDLQYGLKLAIWPRTVKQRGRESFLIARPGDLSSNPTSHRSPSCRLTTLPLTHAAPSCVHLTLICFYPSPLTPHTLRPQGCRTKLKNRYSGVYRVVRISSSHSAKLLIM